MFTMNAPAEPPNAFGDLRRPSPVGVEQAREAPGAIGMQRSRRQHLFDERRGICALLIRGLYQLVVEKSDDHRSLQHQVLAADHVVEVEELDRYEAPKLQQMIGASALRQEPIEGDHIFRVNVQASDRIDQPGLLGRHLPRIVTIRVVRAGNRKVALLEP